MDRNRFNELAPIISLVLSLLALGLSIFALVYKLLQLTGSS